MTNITIKSATKTKFAISSFLYFLEITSTINSTSDTMAIININTAIINA